MSTYTDLMPRGRGELLVRTVVSAAVGYIAMVPVMGAELWMYAVVLAMFLPIVVLEYLRVEASR